MNDFTKYELQSLIWAISYVRDRTNNCGDTMRTLRTKIQSMIDGDDEEISDIPEHIYTQKECSKCNQIVFGCFPCPCEALNDNK